ncbi:MAG: peptidyl-prolyl cis-trans isomerase [Pseudomonadota bacterium]
MRKRSGLLIGSFIVFSLFIISGCGSDSQKEIVAVVGDTKITTAQFQHKIDSLKIKNSAATKIILGDLVDSQVAYAAAVKAGYDKNPDLIQAFQQMVTQRFLNDRLDPIIHQIKVSEEEIEVYYTAHAMEFTTSAMVRAAVIKIEVPVQASADQKERFLQKAEAARNEALKLASHVRSFGEVAINYSDDQSSRYRGGDTGWIKILSKRNRLEKKVMEQLTDLDPGVVSPIIIGENGIYLVKVIERQEPELRPIVQIKEIIRHKVLIDKKKQVEKEFYAGLKKQINVFIDDQAVLKISLFDAQPGDKPPPRLPE